MHDRSARATAAGVPRAVGVLRNMGRSCWRQLSTAKKHGPIAHLYPILMTQNAKLSTHMYMYMNITAPRTIATKSKNQ